MPFVHLDSTSKGLSRAAGNYSRRSARRIGILVADGFSLLRTGIIAEMFHTANKIFCSNGGGDDSFYEVCFLSSYGGNITCSSSIRVWTDGLVATPGDCFDVVFVAGGVDAFDSDGGVSLLRWLRADNPKREIFAECTRGHALLAAAGIARDNPQSSPHCAISFLEDPGSQNQSLKNAVATIKRDLGHAIASRVTDHMAPRWTAEMVPRQTDAAHRSAADKMHEAARWLRENCEHPISVAGVAEIASMSERHFLRCFKLTLGTLPSAYLLQVRLDMASRLLTETELPVDKIARRVGLTNGDRLAKIFRKRMSMSPREFRVHSGGKEYAAVWSSASAHCACPVGDRLDPANACDTVVKLVSS